MFVMSPNRDIKISWFKHGSDITMSKAQTTKTSTINDIRTSVTTLRLDCEWMMFVNLLATSNGNSMSGFIQQLISNHLALMPRDEAESYRKIIKAKTGRTLYCDRSGVKTSTESKVQDTDDGRAVVDQAESSLSKRLRQIEDKSVDQPISDALASLYGN